MTTFYLNNCLKHSLFFPSFHRNQVKKTAISSLLFLFLGALYSPASAKFAHRTVEKTTTTFANVQILSGDITEGGDMPGFSKLIGGQNFSFIFPASNYAGWFNDIGGGTFGGLYVYEGGTPDATHFTLASPNGYSFDLNSFQYISDRGSIVLTLTVTYTNNATAVQNYTLNGNSTVQTLAGLGTMATDIKSIEFVSDQLLYYNNLDITDVKTTTVLPVRLITFRAQRKAANEVLQWQTAMEQNAKDFVVEHSTNGYNWQQLGTVAAYQNATKEQAYEFTHQSPGSGIHYYRLLQRDMDGKESYSKIVVAEWNGSASPFRVYPNPVHNGNLSIVLQKEGVVNIYNSAGMPMLKKRMTAGVHALDVSFLSKGFYVVQVNDESITVVLQ